MLTIWKNPDKTELNLKIKQVGEIYEQLKSTKSEKEIITEIRRKVCVGTMDARKLLKVYLAENKTLTL